MSFSTSASATSDVGSYAVVAGGLSSNNYAFLFVPGTLSITPADQAITWNPPAGIVYGTPLDAAQLDAVVNVPGPAPAGSLAYTPAAGTIPKSGSGQVLSVVAAATNDYNQATAQVPINVQKATPVLTWTVPADLAYGTPLGPAQLDASASFDGTPLAGTFTYTPAPAAVLDAGSGQTLAVVFTPGDTTDFNTAMATATINVDPLTPVFDALAAPTITYGTSQVTLSGQFAAGALIPPGNVAITLDGVTQSAAIDPATGSFSTQFATAVLGASASPYSVSLAYAGTADFTAAAATTLLTVAKASQTIHWTTPADIVYGTPLSAHQLDATASFGGAVVAGAFAYSAPAGTVLNAGPGQALAVTFTPADSADFNPATASVLINVLPAP